MIMLSLKGAILLLRENQLFRSCNMTTFRTGKVVINGNSLLTGNAQLIAKDGKIIVGDNAKLFSAPHLA